MWPLKCQPFYGIVSVHEREQGTKSKRCNTRKSLLLMHPSLSWYFLCRMLFKCGFSKLALFLIQVKQKSQMQKPGSMFVLSLTGRIPLFNSGQTKVPRNNLRDLVTSLQGLTSKESVENGTRSNVFCLNNLNFAQQKDSLAKPAVCCCSWHIVAASLTLWLEATRPSNIRSTLIHVTSLFFSWKFKSPFQNQMMVI